MEPPLPVIFPSSGVYKPPVSVVISAPGLQVGEAIFYVIEALNAAPKRFRYVAPFVITELGRVRITAFVWREGFGEGRRVNAIYELEDRALSAAVRSPLSSSAGVTSPALFLRQKPEIDAVPMRPLPQAQPLHRLVFNRIPTVIRSLEPFDVELMLYDSAGCEAPGTHHHLDATIVVHAEMCGAGRTNAVSVPLPTQPQKLGCRSPPFTQTQQILVEGQQVGAGGSCSLSRTTSSSSPSSSWDCFANTSPCIGARLSGYNALSVEVASVTRAIVGLHTGLEDTASPLAWRFMLHSFHISADLSDPHTCPAFRVYEYGSMVESCGTRDVQVGDELGIRVNPNGDVLYLHNAVVVHISEARPEAELSTTYSVHIRVAAQQGPVALTNVRLIEAGEPFAATVAGLMWRPALEGSTATPSAAIEGDVSQRIPGRTDSIVIRAWITGSDYIPAVARVPVESNTVPRWAFAALSLSSMFALGTAGCQNGHISTLFTDRNAKGNQLIHLGHRGGGGLMSVLERVTPAPAGLVNSELWRSTPSGRTKANASVDASVNTPSRMVRF